MDGRLTKRPDVTVTLKCNNRCVFCPRTILSHIAVKSPRGLKERLRMIRRGGDRVVLTGGEVTILDDFFGIVGTCRDMGFRDIAVISNGRKFSDARFARRALASGITEICVTLYDLRSEVHDGITGVTGSLEETLSGIRNILKGAAASSGPVLRINTILCARNADGMVGLVGEMARLGISSILIADAVLSESFPEPLPYGRVREIVRRIAGEKPHAGSSLVLRGFPLCVLGGIEGVAMEGGDAPGCIRAEGQNIDTVFTSGDEIEKYFSEFYSNFTRVDACGRCTLARRCPGVQRRYVEAYGAGEFFPLGACRRNPSSAAAPAGRSRACVLARGSLYDQVQLHPSHPGAHRPRLGWRDLDRRATRRLTMYFSNRLLCAGDAAPVHAATGRQVLERLIVERPEPARIEITPTTACQLRCSYCKVKLGKRHAPPEVLDRAVDLLMTYSSRRPELQFFGGEPLIRLDEVKRTIRRADRLVRTGGREILFTITTNGLLLDGKALEFFRDYNVRILFSMDGDFQVQQRCRFRGRKDARRLQLVMEKNLDALLASGVSCFVNMVVAPETVDSMASSFEFFRRKGVEVLQVCYAGGLLWDDPGMEAFCSALERMAVRSLERRGEGRAPRLQNIGSYVEPSILSNDIIVDVDGTLYSDAAIFMEKAFPGLRKPYRLGRLGDIASLEGLRPSKKENLAILRGFYGAGSPVRAMVEQQVQLGIRVEQILAGVQERGPREPAPPAARRTASTVSDSNPLLESVFTKGLRAQAEFMRRRPSIMKLPVLLIENNCFHDCIFCKRKPIEPTPLAHLARFLEDNEDVGADRLGLIGNEPLGHPDILKILDQARSRGFEKFEVLTSGQPLADEAFVGELVRSGVCVFSLPLYSASSRGHDLITGTAGSHVRTLKGIDNVLRAGGKVFVHANLLKQNIQGIALLEDLVARELGLHFCIIPVRPKMANLAYGDLAPSYRQMVGHLAGKVRSLVGFPLCVLEKIQSPALIPSSRISDLLKLYLLDQPFVRPPARCGGCPMRKNCTGTYREHLKIYPGDLESP